MRQFSDGRRGVALAAGAGLAWLAFYVGWVLLEPLGEELGELVADTVYLAPLACATALAVAAARRGPPGVRTFWTFMATANALWLAGAILWGVRELTFGVGSVAFPWWTDAAYLASYLPMLLAVLAAFRPSLRTLGAGVLLDAALVVGALALVWWRVMLLPIPLERDLGSLVGLAYPTLDLVLISILVATWLLPARNGTGAMRLVAGGIAAGALVNGTYMRAAVAGGYPAGELMEIGWQAEALLFCLAALVSLRGVDRSPNWLRFRESRELGTGLVVTAALLTVIAMLASHAVYESPAFLVGAAMLASLLIARLWLVFLPQRQALPLTDEETGTYNADYFEDQLGRLEARAQHFGDSFGLALVEVDAFVRDDDDAVDAHIAKRLVRGSRELDMVARLEPGRFAILLPNAERDEAIAVAERMRREVAAEELRTGTGSLTRTVSVGVAVWRADERPGGLAKRAQAALAAAHRLGRNQVRAGADDAILFTDGTLDGERFDLLVSLAKLVDTREGPEPGHSSTVASIASAIALEMGLDADAVSRTYVAGLLHDLGKVALPEAMLQKPGPLDEREWDEMARHSSAGAELVEKIAAVRDAAPIVAAHHERWDGTGYPFRLEGERIPAEARIVAVADALVAMTSDRPYRPARSETSALTTIWRESGKRYDPAVVSALLAIARDGRLTLSEPESKEPSAPSLRVVS